MRGSGPRGLRAAVLAALWALAACAPEVAPTAKERLVRAADASTSVALSADELLTVELDARPSAGFTWQVASIDPDALALAGREHLAAPTLGGLDLERLHFKGLRRAETTLVLVYRRPWDAPGPDDLVYALSVATPGAYAGPDLAPPPALRPALGALQASATAPSQLNLCDPGDGSYARCTPIKNQGSCGGCWAFATAGVFENLLFLANPAVQPALSEQYLISCNSKGWNCANGGNVAFDYYLSKYVNPPETAAGAVYTVDFPFKATDVACGSQPHAHHEKLTGWSSLGRGIATVDAIKQALQTSGPVWTAVCADSAFSNYRYTGGSAADIFRGSCASLNHAVILVGWDDNGGDGYWILRNSWGSRWGDKGYMRIAWGANGIGSESSAAYYNVTPTPANAAPVADAGPAQTVKAGASVALDGSASSDPDGSIVAWAWAQTSGSPAVTLAGAGTARPTFVAPAAAQDTSLGFTLTVTDDRGATSTATVAVAVTAGNVPPVASAGRDQRVQEGDAVALDGSGSADADGSIASYAWAQVPDDAAPTAALTGASTARPAFTAPAVPGGGAQMVLTFRLTVTDSQGAAASATVLVTVVHRNLPPVADAGAARTVVEGATVALDGSRSADPDGTLASFAWAQTGGPAVALGGTTTAAPSFVAPAVQTSTDLTFALTVADEAGASATAAVAITVTHANLPPLADAGPAQTVSGGATAALDGSASADPDGSIAHYAWIQTGGPAVALSGEASARATFVAPALTAAADLTFRLTVTDDAGASSSAAAVVQVLPSTAAPTGGAAAVPTDPAVGSPFAAGCSASGLPDVGLVALPLALAVWRRRRRS